MTVFGLGGVEARLSAAYRRRLLRRAKRPAKLRLEKIGTEYGGWVVPTALIRADWICYDGGVGEDASFAVGLIQRFGCTVHAFDPTPRAIAFVERELAHIPQFKFLPVGLWSEDARLRFWSPRDPTHVSHSIPNLQKTRGYFEAECQSIRSVMDKLGHSRLDLLKLDIEGAEHRVIRASLAAGIRPTVLCTEIDRPVGPVTFWRTVRAIRASGYRLVAVDGWNFTFVRRDALAGGLDSRV